MAIFQVIGLAINGEKARLLDQQHVDLRMLPEQMVSYGRARSQSADYEQVRPLDEAHGRHLLWVRTKRL